MSEGDAPLSLDGPLVNGNPVRDGWFSPPISSPAAPLCLALGEIPRQPGSPAGRAVDVSVDGLGADGVVHFIQLPPPGDLFRRPSHGKAVSDVIAKAGGALDLRATQFADPGHSIGAVRSIAQGTAVPRDLPVDRPAMTAEPASDLARSKAHFDHAAQAASLIKREVAVFGSHGDPGHSRCRTWFGNLAGVVFGRWFVGGRPRDDCRSACSSRREATPSRTRFARSTSPEGEVGGEVPLPLGLRRLQHRAVVADDPDLGP